MSSYNSKVFISGDIVEIYEYSVPVLQGYDIKNTHECGRNFNANDQDKVTNRIKVLNRAKRDLRRIINSNVHQYKVRSKFVTLTFEEHIVDFSIANYEFKKFRQRLEYVLGFKLKYTCVPEFTKKGRIHFHVLMYNCPYIKNTKLAEIWQNGFIRINSIDNVDNVGSYVAEYVGKDYKEGTSTSDKMKGKKCYFNSRGLNKPTEIKNKEMVQVVLDSLPPQHLVYENTFENDYNSVRYQQFNMSKDSNTKTKYYI